MAAQTHGWIRLVDVHIDGVRVGIYPHERDGVQSIVVNIRLWTNIRKAAKSGKIEDTLDYDKIAALVRRISREKYYSLLETMCETIAAALLKEFSVKKVAIEITKPGALAPGGVSVAIERSR